MLLLFNQSNGVGSGGATGTAFQSFVEAGMFLGNWDIDEYLTFTACTHDDMGAAADADAVPSYAIYEDETATAIITGNMAQLGAVTGFYTERVQLTAAAGFEAGKMYAIRVEAVMGGVTAAAAHSFAVKTASANVTLWNDAVAPALLDLDTVLETPVTLGEALRVMLAALAGKTDGSGTPALTFLGQDGATVRIAATVDGIGNRTAVTVDGA